MNHSEVQFHQKICIWTWCPRKTHTKAHSSSVTMMDWLYWYGCHPGTSTDNYSFSVGWQWCVIWKFKMMNKVGILVGIHLWLLIQFFHLSLFFNSLHFFSKRIQRFFLFSSSFCMWMFDLCIPTPTTIENEDNRFSTY